MRGKDYNTGLRGVLFEAQHHARMGAAIWLYGWLVLRQTHQSGPVGWVLGGAPICYREIEQETGFNCRTLERWMSILRREGYIETSESQNGVSIRITKAKKFPQAPRKSAEGVRNFAGGTPQTCGSNTDQIHTWEQLTDRIGSSSVVRIKEKETQRKIHSPAENKNQNQSKNYNQNPSGLGQRQNQSQNQPHNQEQIHNPPQNQFRNLLGELRLRQQLLRVEREEAVRRELAVGTGPEVRRS